MSVATTVDAGMSVVAVKGIRFYQKWISPYKGFRCAHHALHGQGSCSHFGLHAFLEHPFSEAWRLLRARFKECGAAYAVLMSESEKEKRKRRSSGGDGVASMCDDMLTTCFFVEMFEGCSGVESCDIAACSCE
ncbi:MAG TPA: membrane protein insertion efficiency factor YidD [Candidatus Paceibacterota bacterium]|nr:membrane protein insertion efficiency factor YidD [Candidatus Paceibacterota bacterium]